MLRLGITLAMIDHQTSHSIKNLKEVMCKIIQEPASQFNQNKKYEEETKMLGISNLISRRKPEEGKMAIEGGKNYWLSTAAVFGIILGFIVMATTTFALPPANDDIDNATVISGLPFDDAIDTTEATTDPDDPDCAGQGPTVWYSFTPTEDTRIEANTFGSDYDTTLSAYMVSDSELIQIACNDDCTSLQSVVQLDVFAGETVFFMIGSFGSGPGGHLVFNANADVALEIDLTIDPVGSVVPKTGVATILGTVNCTEPALVSVFGDLVQRAGRFFIRGFFSAFFECDGETPWSATVIGDNGRYAAGKANANASADAFVPDFCEFAFDAESTPVQLRGSKQ